MEGGVRKESGGIEAGVRNSECVSQKGKGFRAMIWRMRKSPTFRHSALAFNQFPPSYASLGTHARRVYAESKALCLSDWHKKAVLVVPPCLPWLFVYARTTCVCGIQSSPSIRLAQESCSSCSSLPPVALCVRTHDVSMRNPKLSVYPIGTEKLF